MNEAQIILNYLTTGIIAGAVGTVVMSLIVVAASRLQLMPVGIATAIGTAITSSKDGAKKIGWIIHFSVGLAFGLLYCCLFMLLNMNPTALYVPVGALIGALHGLAVFFLLVPTLAEHHPLPEIRDVGGAMALTYFVAHVAYGFTVGSVFTLMQ